MTTPPEPEINNEEPFVRIKPYGRWSYSLELVEGMLAYPGPFAYGRRSAERKAARMLVGRRHRQGAEPVSATTGVLMMLGVITLTVGVFVAWFFVIDVILREQRGLDVIQDVPSPTPAPQGWIPEDFDD